MLLLVQFVCLLFVTTATCQIIPNPLPIVQESLNEKMNSSRQDIERHYAHAKTSVDQALLQIKFLSPYDAPPRSANSHKWNFSNLILTSNPKNVQKWKGRGLEIEKKLRQKIISSSRHRPSIACYKFLKTYATTNASAVSECSWHWQQQAVDYRTLLDEVLRFAINRLEEKNDAAKNCETWYDAAFFNNWLAAFCMYRIKWRLPEIVEEAKMNFSAIAKNARRVVNAWIPEAGRCIVANDTLIAALRWNAACSDSTVRLYYPEKS